MSDYSTPAPPPPEAPGPGPISGMGAMPEYQSGQFGEPVARPASIAMAVKLMYVGAGLSLIGALSTFFLKDALRTQVEKASSTSAKPMTSSQIDVAVNVGVGVGIVVGLLGVALWLWMASANGKGRKWARTVATVFFGVSVLSTLSALAQHAVVLSMVVSVVTLLLGAYILYLLYRPESSQYYAAQSAPRV